MTRLASLLMAFLLAGCAASSEAYQVGPDTYQIASTAITSFGGAGRARASAMRTAERFCGERSGHAIVTEAKMDSQFTQGSSQITFRCERGHSQ